MINCVGDVTEASFAGVVIAFTSKAVALLVADNLASVALPALGATIYGLLAQVEGHLTPYMEPILAIVTASALAPVSSWGTAASNAGKETALFAASTRLGVNPACHLLVLAPAISVTNSVNETLRRLATGVDRGRGINAPHAALADLVDVIEFVPHDDASQATSVADQAVGVSTKAAAGNGMHAMMLTTLTSVVVSVPGGELHEVFAGVRLARPYVSLRTGAAFAAACVLQNACG